MLRHISRASPSFKHELTDSRASSDGHKFIRQIVKFNTAAGRELNVAVINLIDGRAGDGWDRLSGPCNGAWERVKWKG